MIPIGALVYLQFTIAQIAVETYIWMLMCSKDHDVFNIVGPNPNPSLHHRVRLLLGKTTT